MGGPASERALLDGHAKADQGLGVAPKLLRTLQAQLDRPHLACHPARWSKTCSTRCRRTQGTRGSGQPPPWWQRAGRVDRASAVCECVVQSALARVRLIDSRQYSSGLKRRTRTHERRAGKRWPAEKKRITGTDAAAVAVERSGRHSERLGSRRPPLRRQRHARRQRGRLGRSSGLSVGLLGRHALVNGLERV